MASIDLQGDFKAPVAPPDQTKSFWQQLADSRVGFLFFAPNLLGFIVFFIVPILASFYLSFTEYDGFAPPRWVGLENYQDILGKSPLIFEPPYYFRIRSDPPYYFWKSLFNTVYYCILYIPLSIGISLFLAILLNAQLIGMKIFRAIYFLPVVSSVIAVSLLWRWIFAVDYGPINLFLVSIGGESWRVGWLREPEWAMVSLVIMAIWRTIGYNVIVILASLQGVPNELYEAAYVDGATRLQVVTRITIPLISPSLFFVLLMSLIGGMQVFAEAYVITGGGPARSTLTVVYNLYQQGFSFLNFGVSSAMGWIVFAIIFSLALVFNFLSKRWVHYS
jgi:multiple sugar transport system permease protein